MKLTRPNRKKYSYTQSLTANPKDVFPLLCPVRELDWTRGWDPLLVLSNSGLVEADCLFVTPGVPENTIWIVTLHEPDRFRLEMLMVTPGRTVGKLEIALFEAGGNKTSAEVSYTHTSLGPVGDAFLDGFTEDWYRRFMEDWEAELNHFLTTGTKLAE